MAAATNCKTAAAKTESPAEDTPKVSRWAQLNAEATADYEPAPDYLFDGTEPPTPIKEPVTAEQVTAFAALIDADEDGIDPANIRPLFEAVCGDSFDAVWAVVGRAHFASLLALTADINRHFNAVPAKEGADLPGGA